MRSQTVVLVTGAFTGMVLVHVREGRILEAWNNFDFLTLYEQLGMVPKIES